MAGYYLKSRPVLVLLIALFSRHSFADIVYICNGEGEGGSVLFSDKPCKSGHGQTLQFPDVYTSGEGLSQLERQQLDEIQAREVQAERNTIKLSPPGDIQKEAEPGTGTTAARNNTANSEACRQAEDSLREWGRIMSLGYLPEQKETMEAELNNRIDKKQQACANQQ